MHFILYPNDYWKTLFWAKESTALQWTKQCFNESDIFHIQKKN